MAADATDLDEAKRRGAITGGVKCDYSGQRVIERTTEETSPAAFRGGVATAFRGGVATAFRSARPCHSSCGNGVQRGSEVGEVGMGVVAAVCHRRHHFER